MNSLRTAASTIRKRWSLSGALKFIIYVLLVLYCTGIAIFHSSFFDSVVLIPSRPAETEYDQCDKIMMQGPPYANAVGLPHPTQAKHEEYYFTNSAGDKLHAYFWRSPKSDKVVLIHHGTAGTVPAATIGGTAIFPLGPSVFAYDYRGYGKSTGQATIKGIVDDGIAAFDFVNHQLHFDSKNIINYGASIGSGVACCVARARPTGGLVLQSAIGSLPMVGRDKLSILRIYPDLFFPQPQLNNVTAVKDVHVPLLLVHGAKDHIPVSHAEMIYANANAPKKLVILRDSQHTSVDSVRDGQDYINAMQLFLDGLPSTNTTAAPIRH